MNLKLTQREVKYLHDLLEREAKRIRNEGGSRPLILSHLIHELWEARVHPTAD